MSSLSYWLFVMVNSRWFGQELIASNKFQFQCRGGLHFSGQVTRGKAIGNWLIWKGQELPHRHDGWLSLSDPKTITLFPYSLSRYSRILSSESICPSKRSLLLNRRVFVVVILNNWNQMAQQYWIYNFMTETTTSSKQSRSSSWELLPRAFCWLLTGSEPALLHLLLILCSLLLRNSVSCLL